MDKPVAFAGASEPTIGRASDVFDEFVMQIIPLVRAKYVYAYAAVLERLGAPRRRLLERVGLSERVLEDPEAVIPAHQAWAFIGSTARKEGTTMVDASFFRTPISPCTLALPSAIWSGDASTTEVFVFVQPVVGRSPGRPTFAGPQLWSLFRNCTAGSCFVRVRPSHFDSSALGSR